MKHEEEGVVVSWEDIAKMVFPEIQREYPEWRGKTLDEFIRDWPAPTELVNSWSVERFNCE
jgi:hypothetical protein